MKSIKVKSISNLKNPTIGIFSPSEPVVDSRMTKFNNGISILKNQGFEVKYAENCFKHTNFTAGSIEDRINDINSLLQDEDIDLLLASWGGKSCNQLVSYLDYELIKEKRKPILGFSDPCVLSNSISAKTGLITFYGPNVVGKMNETEHSHFDILRDSSIDLDIFKNSQTGKAKTIFHGNAKGKLIGGNLSTFTLGVASSIIDPSYYNGAILIWEDLGNPPQIINQYLTALDNMGILQKIGGMIIGYFISEDSKEWKKVSPFEPIIHFCNKYKIPTLYIPTFGHANLENPIFPIGAECELNTDNINLTIKEQITE